MTVGFLTASTNPIARKNPKSCVQLAAPDRWVSSGAANAIFLKMKTLPLSSYRSLPKRSLQSVIAPLEAVAANSDSLFAAHFEFEDPRGGVTRIPRFLFTGPGDRRSFLRVGIFAGVHGDEVSGVSAAVELLERLHANPEPATGYELFVYPVCNPWGYSQDARWLRSRRPRRAHRQGSRSTNWHPGGSSQ